MKKYCKPIPIAMYCTRKLEGAIKGFGGFEAFFFVGIRVRYCPRFFDQVGHQTTYASMGNKHFITK